MSDNLEQDLDDAFIAPDTYFKGEKLAPYTEGSRLLMLQVRNDADSPIFFVYAFVYIHILLAQDRRAAIKLAWDRDAFREKLLEWSENMNEDDRNTASLVCSSILGAANKSRVNVIPSALAEAAPPNA